MSGGVAGHDWSSPAGTCHDDLPHEARGAMDGRGFGAQRQAQGPHLCYSLRVCLAREDGHTDTSAAVKRTRTVADRPSHFALRLQVQGIVGRSKKQRIVCGVDYVIEKLNVDGNLIEYKQARRLLHPGFEQLPQAWSYCIARRKGVLL